MAADAGSRVKPEAFRGRKVLHRLVLKQQVMNEDAVELGVSRYGRPDRTVEHLHDGCLLLGRELPAGDVLMGLSDKVFKWADGPAEFLWRRLR